MNWIEIKETLEAYSGALFLAAIGSFIYYSGQPLLAYFLLAFYCAGGLTEFAMFKKKLSG